MATSEFTSHYHIDKYAATDKPNLRDQYNAAMDKIDDALYTSNTNAADAKSAAQRAEGAVSGKASQADLDALSALLPNSQFSAQNTVKAALDAKASQADLDALSALLPNSQFSAQNTVKAALDAKASQSELDFLQTTVDNISEKYFVIFGDSWNAFVAESRPNWFELGRIGRVLGCTLKNFGVGGAGYVGGSSLISTQINTAASQMTANEKARTRYVVFLAGVNDSANTSLDYQTWLAAVRSAVSNAQSLFPNAKIVVAPNACSPNFATNGRHRFKQMNQWASQLCDDLKWNANAVLITKNCCYFWGASQPSSIVYSDNLHPNTAGGEAIGKIILSCFTGGSSDIHYSLNNRFSIAGMSISSAEYSSTNLGIYIANGNIIITGSITKASGTYAEVDIDIPIQIQEYMLARYGLNPNSIPYIAVQASGNNYLWIRAKNDCTKFLCAATTAGQYFFA